MMLSRRKPSRSGIERAAQRTFPRHRQWVRGFQCAVQNDDCGGDIECAHVRSGTNGGMGLKPGDEWCIPLCRDHHHEQHTIGEMAFEKLYGIDMKVLARGLARNSPVQEVRQRVNESEKP